MSTTLVLFFVTAMLFGGGLFLHKFSELMKHLQVTQLKSQSKVLICQKALLMAIGFGLFIIGFVWLLGYIRSSYLVMIGG